MRISFVSTVFNEEKTIVGFLESLFSQSKLPDEIIIVDGGSSDNTVAKIKDQRSKIKSLIRFKIILKKGNRAVGRNEAIKSSSGDIIVCSDAGCVLDKDWIKNITKPFSRTNIDVVAGYYKGAAKTVFEKCLIPYVLVMPDKADPNNFLPATRSMAFKKRIWEKVGGFEEQYSHNEDYVFAKKLKQIGAKIVFERKAIVYWIPRKTIKEAIIMFFRFAMGDMEAQILRPKVFLLFLRYVLFLYLITLFTFYKSVVLFLIIVIGICTYTFWAIFKNYKYVKDIKGIIILPFLQIVSDFVVLLGTIVGLLKTITHRAVINIIHQNLSGFLLILVYITILLSIIRWGIPNNTHPFNYFMDEWHQSKSVYSVFKYGTPNIEGSANGSMFHFLISGFLLIPFYLTGFINPFVISSSVENLEMQEKLFIALRLNTLFFGILSIICIGYIARKYFKISSFLPMFFFIINPMWLSLSNYFKYDIALIFWILLTVIFLLRYGENPSRNNYLLASFLSGLAVSVKISAVPFIPVFFLIYILFTPKEKRSIGMGFLGIFISFAAFLFFGIPDLIFGKGDMKEYIYDNLIRAPGRFTNIVIDQPYVFYLVTRNLEIVFGKVFYFLLILSILFFTLRFVFCRTKRIVDYKKYLILIICLAFFAISLFPLKFEARGNRLLVLLPFLSLLLGIYITKMISLANKTRKFWLLGILSIVLLFQSIESFSWVNIKLLEDSRQISSKWISKNIPKEDKIGIENIPIYQSLPNLITKEFYTKQSKKEFLTRYDYVLVDHLSQEYPSYVVITNDEVTPKYLKQSQKELLIRKLQKKQFTKIKTFYLDKSLYRLFGNDVDYMLSGLIQAPETISIYKMKKE